MQPQQYQMGGYDRTITMFSPDGRLYQVEYAREAVKRGTTAVGIKCKSGVVLLVDKRVNSRLLESSSIEKIFKIDEHIGVASSGLVGDARILVDRARIEAQINRVSYGEPIDIQTLAKKLCDHMQTYTLFGGARPYGTALLIAGVEISPDGTHYHLFETDPSGTLLEYSATGIGIGRPAVIKLFEKEYKETLSAEEAVQLGLKALYTATEGKFDMNTVEIGIAGDYSKKRAAKVVESPTGANGSILSFRKLNADEVKAAVAKFSKTTPAKKE
ncbi:MAG: archaeal proteasome endopeptidase complex subunit alpha [Methanocorpusculum sp.]|nr:archaeal proteasome endopeptidase complex subunit alpha [Methanocorpusculum sp.]MDD2470539.1 archaeal proteasome endopeptidase complex subunit alpha [Methanocorpusculum sp.]MDD3256820.1 archaeal proteasome endopeptidase complex subunit alpha [Methanocorpusculum sp.]MDD4132577.1 archaeal proteasome endopeptidase complex subunit alpha [Methanocorpusculum sp.]